MTMEKAIAIIIMTLLLMVAGPALSIMALNTVFGLSIELTVGTYFAMMWLHMMIGAMRVAAK